MDVGWRESIAVDKSVRGPLKILLCCEFYAPSVGGVQEVMRQLAEHLVLRGHSVTVATTDLPERQSDVLNGVLIKGFPVSGNQVRGIVGQRDAYTDFVVKGLFDVVLIKAAQQWTFDALWPVLSQITAAKLFIPCGFSALHEPAYADYFRQLPHILRQFDRLIFYATEYRDVAFAKQQGLTNLAFLTNGASEVEFATDSGTRFRERTGIGTDEWFFLTVGSPPWQKGQLEVAEAFERLDVEGRPATLLLNGNWQFDKIHSPPSRWNAVLRDDWNILLRHGLLRLAKVVCKRWMIALHLHGLLRRLGYKAEPITSGWLHQWRATSREYGWRRATRNALKLSLVSIGLAPVLRWLGYEVEFAPPAALLRIMQRIHRQGTRKRVQIGNLSRPDLVEAFFAADLFLFASRVEYSPLVLFESAAAGTPFLTVPVGNAEEIAQWTGAGVVCPAGRDAKGYTVTDPEVFAVHWGRLLADQAALHSMGEEGRRRWQEAYTWERITAQYEALLYQALAVEGATI